MLKMVGKPLIAAVMFLSTAGAQAAPISLGDSGSGYWYSGLGSIISIGDLSLAAPTGVSIKMEDCCASGDVFSLLLDGVTTPWTASDFGGSWYGSSLFRGDYTGLLGTGTHSIAFQVTADCCGYGEMKWSVAAAPVPEPETYAMLLAGLGLLSFTAKRRRQSA